MWLVTLATVKQKMTVVGNRLGVNRQALPVAIQNVIAAMDANASCAE